MAAEETATTEDTATAAAPSIEATTSHPPPSAEAVAEAAAALQAAFDGQTTSSQPPREKRKSSSREITNVPSRDPTCYECGKRFATWKAVFGHLRIHTDRPFRGAFPPPVGADWTPPSSSSASAADRQQCWRQEPRLGFGVDLNVPFMPMINDGDEVHEVDTMATKRRRIIDLNRRATDEEAATSKEDEEETKDEEEKDDEAERDHET
ncbi:unnamed protein product [Linum trigynum]